MITDKDIHTGKVSEITAYGKTWKIGKIIEHTFGENDLSYRIIINENSNNEIWYVNYFHTKEFINSGSLAGTEFIFGKLESYATTPHYIPFDSVDELIPHLGKPLQYKLVTDNNDIVIITALDRKNKLVTYNGRIGNLKNLFESFVFLDGTPVGKLAPANSINEYEFQAKHSQRDYFAKITIDADRINLYSCGYISFDTIREVTVQGWKVNVRACGVGIKDGKKRFMENWIVDHHMAFESSELANSFCNKLSYRQKEKYRPEHIAW